jgi:hypothetical protein
MSSEWFRTEYVSATEGIRCAEGIKEIDDQRRNGQHRTDRAKNAKLKPLLAQA